MSSELQSRFFPTSVTRLSYKYKKVAFVEYTDRSFTRRKNSEKSLLGPLLKGKVSDQIHVSRSVRQFVLHQLGPNCSSLMTFLFLQITLKNTASRPFNIYPNGLSSIRPMKRSKNGKLGSVIQCNRNRDQHTHIIHMLFTPITPENNST